MAPELIQTSDLEGTFQALKNSDPSKYRNTPIQNHPEYKSIPYQNFAPTTSVSGAFGGMHRYASASSNAGMIYGQPQFFSPVHTPINWQIPSKRLEQYQWTRFFYCNEPKVAAAIDFYSAAPMNGFENECKDRKVKKHFDKLKDRINLEKWLKLMSHEIHLLGDCFPFIEISCQECGGSGRIGDEICEHDGGTVRRLVILNPDYVEVFSSPLDPEPVIALKPDEELMKMVQNKVDGHDRLTPEVRALIAAGRPIRLDNRNVSHLKYGEGGYDRYGTGMVRRLFPVLSYKTKLMVAQWIVAERLIVPIKIVKVGNDERPAGPADIAAVQEQLAQSANDPNLTIVTHHAFELDWYGACHDDQTEVLTENGWKKYEDVSKHFDEKIATYNLDKNTIEYQIPNEYHEYDYDGELIRFSDNVDVDVVVTPNHDMLVSNDCKNWKKTKAAEIKLPVYFKNSDQTEDKECSEFYVDKDNISKIKYNGKVWCFTVPNGFIVTRRNNKIGIHGNSGKVLTLSNEFELINQEILDGMMINNALLNGEGPTFASASVGIEAMIERLQGFRKDMARWIEQKIYLPEAKRQGFIDEDKKDSDEDGGNDDAEDEYIYPKVKWNSMHFRDQQQFRTFALQLYEKGLLSAQTVLEAFDFDPDQEIERKRYDAIQMAAMGQGLGQQGGAGGAPGGMGGMGGMPDLGGGGMGGMGGAPGGDMGGMGGAPGGEAGGAPISAPGGGAPMAQNLTSISASNQINPAAYGGKILKEKTRQKMDASQQKLYKQVEKQRDSQFGTGTRDEKGRIVFTKCERQLLDKIGEYKKNGLITYPVIAQYPVRFGSTEYPIDFALPNLKIGIEADGETFHSSPKQMAHDKERDMKLAQAGWTILRFKDTEIEEKGERVMSAIVKTIMQKEAALGKLNSQDPQNK